MSLAAVPGQSSIDQTTPEEINMTATYTFDVFTGLDCYGAASANWTTYRGKQGPQFV